MYASLLSLSAGRATENGGPESHGGLLRDLYGGSGLGPNTQAPAVTCMSMMATALVEAS